MLEVLAFAVSQNDVGILFIHVVIAGLCANRSLWVMELSPRIGGDSHFPFKVIQDLMNEVLRKSAAKLLSNCPSVS